MIEAFRRSGDRAWNPGAFAARASMAPKACAQPLRYTPTRIVRGWGTQRAAWAVAEDLTALEPLVDRRTCATRLALGRWPDVYDQEGGWWIVRPDGRASGSVALADRVTRNDAMCPLVVTD